MDGYLGSYATLGVLLVVAGAFFVVAYTANRILRTNAPSAAKSTSYECGLDPAEGSDWAQAQIRYYVYAFLYALFAVESVFLFPWAVVFDGLGMVTVAEMGVFVAVLALGLLYAWRKGVLTWT